LTELFIYRRWWPVVRRLTVPNVRWSWWNVGDAIGSASAVSFAQERLPDGNLLGYQTKSLGSKGDHVIIFNYLNLR
jgi:hypothetical protein